MTAARARTPAPAGDDKPFDFNLDTVKAEVDLTPFRFHYGGKRWTFPHIQDLDVWELVVEAEGGDAGSIIQMFTVALGDDLAEFRKIPMPTYKMTALFKAWQKHSGLEAGESEGSTDS